MVGGVGVGVAPSDFKDPFHPDPTSYLFPKTSRRSSSSNSDPAQSLLQSMGDGEMKKLIGDLEVVLEKEPGLEARGNGDGQPQAKKRRPDLGIKRARFSLMPENRENAPQIDTKPNFNQLEDPEDYFSAYERMEFADKEMRKLRGESVLEVQGQNEQVGGARVRRPALQLGRKSTFGFLYPKFSDHLENVSPKKSSEAHASAQLIPELNGLDNRGQNLDSVVGDTSRDMVETDIQENKTSAEDIRGSAGDMLGELLVSCRNLNDTQTRNLLQDRLNIKPLVLEKLDLPDLDCMPTINLEEPEVDWRSRKSNPSSQPTDGTRSGWNILAKDQPPTMGAENMSPARITIEAAKLPSSGGKNSVSYLRRTLSTILGRNEDNLFSGENSPASQTKIAKETNLPLSGRKEIKFRSGSNMLPKPLNLKEGVCLERDSGSIRLSLNMNSEKTTPQSFREEEVVANSQDESVTVESRLEVEALEKEPGDVNINQRASRAKIAKEKHSALSGRTEIKLRSGSKMLPKTLYMNEGLSLERDSRSIRLPLNMNSEETTPQSFREKEVVVGNPQEESLTVESRLEVEAFEKEHVDVNINQRDDFTQPADMHVDKSFDKYDSATVENTEEMDIGNLPEESVSLQPVIPSESCSTKTPISNQVERTKDKEIELPPVEVLEKSNNGTDAKVKEATGPISDDGTKSRGRNKRIITRSLAKKHSVSVLVLEKDAPSLNTTTVEEGIQESSDGLKEPDPVRIETVVAQQTKTRPERQSRRSALKRLSLAEKLAATLDSSPTEKLLPESSVVMEEQESAGVEFNTASENEIRQDMITESNRVGTTDAAVKEKAQRKVVKRRKETRKSLVACGTEWQGGVRRSTRPKRKPLRWYKGERFIYGRIHESLATVIGVKYATKDDGKNIEYDVECCVEEKYREILELGSYH